MSKPDLRTYTPFLQFAEETSRLRAEIDRALKIADERQRLVRVQALRDRALELDSRLHAEGLMNRLQYSGL